MRPFKELSYDLDVLGLAKVEKTGLEISCDPVHIRQLAMRYWELAAILSRCVPRQKCNRLSARGVLAEAELPGTITAGWPVEPDR